MDGNEAMAHDITNQTKEENEMWAERVYQKNRIEHLNDMAECLIENWRDEPDLKIDLDEILKAINDRIELIRKGEV